jgi:hypothetical protein
MRSNPEEFFRGETDRWTWLFREDIADLMSDDERNALQAEYEVIRKKEFHNKVLKTILQADRPEEVTETYAYHGNAIAGGSRVTLGSVWGFAPQGAVNVNTGLQLGKTTLTEKDLQRLMDNLPKEAGQ